VYRETARWYPTVPLGMPNHSTPYNKQLRWYVLTSLWIGTPRRVIQTDIYDGYCIPEGEWWFAVYKFRSWCSSASTFVGTTIYPNIWWGNWSRLTLIKFPSETSHRAISRDETRFEDPDCFKPERFLNSEGPPSGINDMLLFGFGRRCD
jgi:hypothetical protein